MASETVPAAANGPHDPATTPAPTGLAGALARIEPTRPDPSAFTLDPDNAASAGVGTTSSSTSSADYHDTEPTPGPATTNGSGTGGKGPQPREGAFKTLVRAVAERWRKGADIHIKRLDMQKARHQASQVKETRQVAVNNTPNPGPSRTQNSSGMGSGKGPGKANSGGTGKAPKNSSTHSRDTSNGRSQNGPSGGHRGGKGNSSGSAGDSSRRPQKDTGSRGSTDTPKTSKDTPSKKTDGKGGSGGSGTPGADSSKTPKPGTAGKDGKPGKDAPTTGSKGTDKVRLTKTDKTPKPGNDTDSKPSPGRNTSGDTSKGTGPTSASGDTEKKPTTTGPDGTDKPRGEDTPKTGDKKPDPNPDPKTPTPSKKHRPPRTQPSREAGYRDGHRAARAIAHVQAYRDGTRDGWDDGRKQAAHDKTRLDTARTQRLKQREDTMPTTGPAPIPVLGINSTHVTLPDGRTHTRGEIRNVKHFERLLTDKATDLQKVAEATKSLKTHAEEQAAGATRLAEQARAVEGGDKLIATLTRLHEQAALQAGIADALNARAVRATDSTNTLLTNIDTRYGQIYKAVCDSETDKPAQLFWYRDGAPAHA